MFNIKFANRNFRNNEQNNLKETYLAMVTHDLKSPVNSLIIALKWLFDDYQKISETTKKEIISDMLETAKYMKNLLENILIKSKYEKGDVVLDKKPYPLKKIIETSIENLKYLILDKNQTIKFSYKSLTELVNIDFLEIERVVHNLITNAVENSPKNTEIEIIVTEDKNFVVCSVKNFVNRFEIKNPDDLFEKYIVIAGKEKKISSGLGLFISKQIILAHGGTIKFNIQNSKEVKIIFTIPKNI